jgi:hypothetical protein
VEGVETSEGSITHLNGGSQRSLLFLDGNGLLTLAFSYCDGGNSELTLSVLSYLLKLSTYYNVPGSGLLFLLALLAEFIIPNVTINRICELVEFMQLLDWVFHEMEESP